MKIGQIFDPAAQNNRFLKPMRSTLSVPFHILNNTLSDLSAF
jgi:hypothetical protein